MLPPPLPQNRATVGLAKGQKRRVPLLSGIQETFVACEASIKRYLGRYLYKPEDIDDMAQETFLRAYTATQHRNIESPKAYLFQVAKTMAMKELTKKSRQMTDYLEESEAEEQTVEATLEDHLQAEQKVQLFFDAIAELPPQCRRIFLMRKFQALSHRAIASELGITLSAVEKQVAIGAQRCNHYVEIREKERKDVILMASSHQSTSPEGSSHESF